MMLTPERLLTIKNQLLKLALENNFQDARISNTNTEEYFSRFAQWVDDGYHGDMSFLERNQNLRQNPDELHPNTLRVVSLRYNYLPEQANFASTLNNHRAANISRYALGRDYHKLMRKKLSNLCKKLQQEIGQETNLDYRVFVDSAPVLETAFAEKSGLGWKGKHSLIINESAGSWFFLAEIFINLPLPVDQPVSDKCANCTACITLCPTNAIIGEKEVDATRCISYLTIENKDAIPIELRPLIGNRIYGCDDCQLACPWNRFSALTTDTDFLPKNQLNDISLLELWRWNEQQFLSRLEGSPIRRIGYQSWLRNLAVAIGNSDYSAETIQLLKDKLTEANSMVQEHIHWAINQLEHNKSQTLCHTDKTQKLLNCVTKMLTRDA